MRDYSLLGTVWETSAGNRFVVVALEEDQMVLVTRSERRVGKRWEEAPDYGELYRWHADSLRPHVMVKHA